MIKVDGHSYYLHFNQQIHPNGRPFRLSGISIVTTKPQVWITDLKVYRHNTIYSFRYLDVDNEFFGFEFDAYGKYLSKVI